jgi:hypothetical protein
VPPEACLLFAILPHNTGSDFSFRLVDSETGIRTDFYLILVGNCLTPLLHYYAQSFSIRT